MSVWFWLLAAAAGTVGQLVDAVSGMGFGAFSASVMLAGGVAAPTAIATVNIAKIGSGLASAVSHWRFGNVRGKWVLPLAISGVAGGVGGALLLTSGAGDAVGAWMPWILLAMGLLILRRFLVPGARWPLPRITGGAVGVAAAIPTDTTSHSWRQRVTRLWVTAQLPVIGLAAGLVNALSGAYGPVATSGLILTKKTQPRFIVGTVNFVEFAVAGAVAGTLLARKRIEVHDWQLPVALMIGAVIVAPAGAYITRRVPPRGVGIAVGAVMVGLNLLAIVRG